MQRACRGVTTHMISTNVELPASHETEFYDTFRSISDARVRAIMKISRPAHKIAYSSKCFPCDWNNVNYYCELEVSRNIMWEIFFFSSIRRPLKIGRSYDYGMPRAPTIFAKVSQEIQFFLLSLLQNFGFVGRPDIKSDPIFSARSPGTCVMRKVR